MVSRNMFKLSSVACMFTLGICEIGLWSKTMHVSEFLACYYFSVPSLTPASPGLTLLYLALHRGLLQNLKGFLNISIYIYIYRRGQRKKKILKLK